ncbi:MAG: hypothetical protein JJU02_06480 [Cryomorphaceae bacterium]|nr:hypothetical protein [Cryomorphaceae bacterium]
MKVLGFLLLVIGLLSLYGGLRFPSESQPSVILIGYVFKFTLIFGGIALVNKSKNKKDNR